MSLHLESKTVIFYDDIDEILDISDEEITRLASEYTEHRLDDLVLYLFEIKREREEWWVRFLAYCNRQ